MLRHPKITRYLAKHTEYNAMIHAIGGLGLGLGIASLFALPNMLFVAFLLILLSLVGHVYALVA